LKARFAKAPAPAATAYSIPCDACSHTAAAPAPRTNLLDKLRDRCGKHKGGPATCGSSCDCLLGCAGPTYGAPIAPANVPPTNIPPVVVEPKKPPMEMPPKSTEPKKSGLDAKIPEPNVTAPVPRTTEPKKSTAPEGLNIPALPTLPGTSPGANAGKPALLTSISGPKLNGADSPY
jgi:hypothetical protein